MNDWADDGWLRFMDEHDIDKDSVPRAQLLDMKEAWLHGARTALTKMERVIAENHTSVESQY